jgi:hypothetical protein
MQSAKLIIGVYAGLIPEQPEDEFTKEYAVTSESWHNAVKEGRQAALLESVNGQAQHYAAGLMLRPDRLNWVRTDWIWL